MGCCVVDSGIAVLGTDEEEVKSLENSVVGRVDGPKVEPLVNSVGDKVIVVSSVESASVGGFGGRIVIEDGELSSVVCISETVVGNSVVDIALEVVVGSEPSVGGGFVEEENDSSVDIGSNVDAACVFK